MDNIFEVKRVQLRDKLGEIVPFDYKNKPNSNEHVFTAYIGGTIPVKIKSKLSYQEFCKIC
ncbi:hypothetical protein [Clostridium sp. 001]|uniref:hypothetical protein n=1 Tax=Clostridium sp. 001 TaxID=1970093 RepID=UPI001C2C9EFC|nr:hypothetical protein [Clostridium sp. 001]QXE20021.1 hypothetical protein B5S50_14975 [Clostridium sp. 001]